MTDSGFRKITVMFFFFPKENFRVTECFFSSSKSSHYAFRGMLLEAVTGGLVFMSMLSTVCSNC